jgi:hypothetical protein
MVRQPSSKFSIAVEGYGQLVNMFFTEVTRRFPQATVYDRKSQADKARAAEIRLSKTEFASPEFKALGVKTEASLLEPSPTDIAVRFTQIGDTETVSIVGRNFASRQSCSLASLKSVDDMTAFLRRVCDAVALSG